MIPAAGEGMLRMLSLVDELPRQLLQGADIGARVALPSAAGRRLLLCGMGGSAIAGDLLAPLLAGGGTSLTVWRDYGLPAWADSGDTVVAASYSGQTEETLAAFGAARARGCRLLALSSGGELARLAQQADCPWAALPGGLPPRAALGLNLGVLLAVLDRWGLVPAAAETLRPACEALAAAAAARRWFPADSDAGQGPADPDGNPPAALLARSLQGKFTVIFTAGAEAHPAGRRLQAQLNENSKVPASLAAFPELDHNEIMGWALPPRARDGFALLVLRAGPLSPPLQRRVAATLDLLREEFPTVAVVGAADGHPLQRLLSLVQYGDYLSCHLARWRGVDPVPVERIQDLKRILAAGKGEP